MRSTACMNDGKTAGRQHRKTASPSRKRWLMLRFHVLVNCGTTLYRSNKAAYDLIGKAHSATRADRGSAIWSLGPEGDRVCPEISGLGFTDPKLNGAGVALFDFVCYAAGLPINGILDGRRPELGHGQDPANQTGHLSGKWTTRRQSFSHTSKTAGHHPGVGELNVRSKGHGGSMRAKPDRCSLARKQRKSANDKGWRGEELVAAAAPLSLRTTIRCRISTRSFAATSSPRGCPRSPRT